jgi:hypothetical protein
LDHTTYLLTKNLYDDSKTPGKKAAVFELLELSGELRKDHLSYDDVCCKAFGHPHWRT